eukprot:2636852-Amphidinium_carterae.1
MLVYTEALGTGVVGCSEAGNNKAVVCLGKSLNEAHSTGRREDLHHPGSMKAFTQFQEACLKLSQATLSRLPRDVLAAEREVRQPLWDVSYVTYTLLAKSLATLLVRSSLLHLSESKATWKPGCVSTEEFFGSLRRGTMIYVFEARPNSSSSTTSQKG